MWTKHAELAVSRLAYNKDLHSQITRKQSFRNQTLPSYLNADQLAAQGFYFGG